jgi:hypothetical protein
MAVAAAVPLLIQAAPAIIGAAGAAYGGMAAMSQANYQAEVAKNNAQVAQANAARASVRGGIEAQMKDAEYAQLIGQQTAEQAASGVAVSGRSALRARNTTRLYAAGDRQTIRENANMENYNYRVDATNLLAESKARKAEGRAAMVGGLLSAAGSLAGGYSDIKKSAVGGATSSAKPPIPRMRPSGTVPIPRPRPMPSIGYSNPLLRSKSMGGKI